MNPRSLHLAAVFSLLAIALSFAEPQRTETTGDGDAIKKAVLDTNAKMTEAANNLNVEAFFNYMADPCVIIQNGVVFKSRSEAMEAVKRGFAGLSKIDRQINDPQVTVISPETALLSAEGHMSATLTDGRTLDGGRFAVSVIFVRKDGQWKVLHGHYSMPVKM